MSHSNPTTSRSTDGIPEVIDLDDDNLQQQLDVLVKKIDAPSPLDHPHLSARTELLTRIPSSPQLIFRAGTKVAQIQPPQQNPTWNHVAQNTLNFSRLDNAKTKEPHVNGTSLVTPPAKRRALTDSNSPTPRPHSPVPDPSAVTPLLPQSPADIANLQNILSRVAGLAKLPVPAPARAVYTTSSLLQGYHNAPHFVMSHHMTDQSKGTQPPVLLDLTAHTSTSSVPPSQPHPTKDDLPPLPTNLDDVDSWEEGLKLRMVIHYQQLHIEALRKQIFQILTEQSVWVPSIATASGFQVSRSEWEELWRSLKEQELRTQELEQQKEEMLKYHKGTIDEIASKIRAMEKVTGNVLPKMQQNDALGLSPILPLPVISTSWTNNGPPVRSVPSAIEEILGMSEGDRSANSEESIEIINPASAPHYGN